MENKITSLQLANRSTSRSDSHVELQGDRTARLVERFLTPEAVEKLNAFVYFLSLINKVCELLADRKSERDCWSAKGHTAIANNDGCTPQRLTSSVTTTKAARMVEHYLMNDNHISCRRRLKFPAR